MTDERLAAIKERADAATPGPWAWRGDRRYGPTLSTVHGGRRTVMDFVRLGMQYAQPRFRSEAGMVGAKAIAVLEVPYREDIVGIDHPDAEFIAHAREDVPFLLSLVESLTGRIERQRADSQYLNKLAEARGREVESLEAELAEAKSAAKVLREMAAEACTGGRGIENASCLDREWWPGERMCYRCRAKQALAGAGPSRDLEAEYDHLVQTIEAAIASEDTEDFKRHGLEATAGLVRMWLLEGIPDAKQKARQATAELERLRRDIAALPEKWEAEAAEQRARIVTPPRDHREKLFREHGHLDALAKQRADVLEICASELRAALDGVPDTQPADLKDPAGTLKSAGEISSRDTQSTEEPDTATCADRDCRHSRWSHQSDTGACMVSNIYSGPCLCCRFVPAGDAVQPATEGTDEG